MQPNQYRSNHEAFAEYGVGEPIPYIYVQGLTPAWFLGKSEHYALLEYQVYRGKSRISLATNPVAYALMILPIDADIMYPPPSKRYYTRKRAKYDVAWWKSTAKTADVQERFALLENAALNEATWHHEMSLYETYDLCRFQRLIKTESRKIREWAIGLQQPQLPGFETNSGPRSTEEPGTSRSIAGNTVR